WPSTERPSAITRPKPTPASNSRMWTRCGWGARPGRCRRAVLASCHDGVTAALRRGRDRFCAGCRFVTVSTQTKVPAIDKFLTNLGFELRQFWANVSQSSRNRGRILARFEFTSESAEVVTDLGHVAVQLFEQVGVLLHCVRQFGVLREKDLD